MRDYPPGVVRVYDNGGRTVDRFSVYFGKVPNRARLYDGLFMSALPFHPQGFGQHGEGMLGRHNGRVIDFRELPDDCRRAVWSDLGVGLVVGGYLQGGIK